MAKQSRAELIGHFQEQIDFLRRSAAAFDMGAEHESKRLAAILRVLLHNSNSSKSLFKQLGVQHQLNFLDTKERPPPAKPGVITRTWDAGLVAIELGRGKARFKPPFDNTSERQIYGPQRFRNWWKRDILKDLQGRPFTRENFVLFMAHKVGGVHVDPEIQSHYKALTDLNSLGWGWHRENGHIVLGVPATPDQEPLGNPIPANVRQIAYEVEQTITEQLAHLLSRPPTP